MNLCRCENGHFYDREKFMTCPHCANGLAGDDGMTEVYQDPNAMGGGYAPMGPAPMGDPWGSPQPVDATMPMMGGGAPMGGFGPQDIDATMPFYENPEMAQAQAGASDEEDDHTVAFMEDVFSEVAGKSTAPSAGGSQSEKKKPHSSAPCVGWLIAINGSHIGQDFRLVTGKNFIGRGDDMDVCLSEEKSVSRNRHAVVVYEPKKHLYLVQPGESSTLVYHNDDVVLNPVELSPYDQITVGDVNMVFIPLCNRDFNWSDLLQEMKSQSDKQ